MAIKTVIFGLGRIGAFYPSSSQSVYRNHLDIILNKDEFVLNGLIDNDKKKISSLKKMNPILSDDVFYSSLSQIYEKEVDLLVISTPTKLRLAHLNLAIKIKPKVILVEKPLAPNIKDALSILKTCKKKRKNIFFNFTRRYSKGFQEIRQKLGKRKPKLILFRYNKGLINYGSHFIDFLTDWYGEIDFVRAINEELGIHQDKSMSFYCRMKNNIDVMAQMIEGVNYDQFEIDLFFKEMVVSMKNGGKEKYISESKESMYYNGYTHLKKPKIFCNQDLIGNLEPLYQRLSDYILNKRKTDLCDLSEAFYNMKVIDALKKSYSNNSIRVKVN